MRVIREMTKKKKKKKEKKYNREKEIKGKEFVCVLGGKRFIAVEQCKSMYI